jgi:hypothetical protein
VRVTALGWALTIGVILALLALDLLLATVCPHAVSYREATAWSVFYITVAGVFGLVLATWAGWGYGTQYFAGYIVEESLSADNLLVFVIIMAAFAVPREHQQRVLIFGIITALVLRAIFIAVGRPCCRCCPSCSWSSGCCCCGPPCGSTATATRTPTSRTTRWSACRAGSCRSPPCRTPRPGRLSS